MVLHDDNSDFMRSLLRNRDDIACFVAIVA